jgi:hypothetical protein
MLTLQRFRIRNDVRSEKPAVAATLADETRAHTTAPQIDQSSDRGRLLGTRGDCTPSKPLQRLASPLKEIQIQAYDFIFSVDGCGGLII